MSDTKMTLLENIFRDMITIIGYEKAVEIVTSMKSSEEKPKKVATDEKPKKAESVDEKKKRIPRMSPTLAKQFLTELGKVGLKYSDDDKKEFDKIKKEFTTYVDDLTDDDFTAKSLTDHMREFAMAKMPQEKVVKTEEKVAKTEEKVVKTEAKPKKAGKKKDDPKKEDTLEPPSNAATVHAMTLAELQSIEMVASPNGKPTGVYWDAVDGRWVRGPDADADEEIVETKFKGKSYMVGENTGRIYEETDDRDVFHGFVGVGQFREMKMPA